MEIKKLRNLEKQSHRRLASGMRIVECFAEHASNMKKIKTYETDNLVFAVNQERFRIAHLV